ncbi:Minichromosome maintenance protein mcm6 [Giardia duodenalis assemblage B]|uniref:Minichromosome maintenance protein mcm6 n=2 Tax=Giardia intestinalis TaxID=5741 RepID=A0A132NR29_GIAIN|nr:Minichromosome maintenance protein mcm6 [Giardia intestinalis]KWX12468.1 Minichromosome maintenance protein mcm6 [Giardia intestinalis assemblage B]
MKESLLYFLQWRAFSIMHHPVPFKCKNGTIGEDICKTLHE